MGNSVGFGTTLELVVEKPVAFVRPLVELLVVLILEDIDPGAELGIDFDDACRL